MNDAILYWNDVALEANRVSHTNGRKEQTGPTLSSRALAIVHLAMYDAYAAIDPTAGGPYLPGLPAPPPTPPATTQAAVAGAAYGTLWALFPSQRGYFDARLAEAGGILDPGHHFGHQIALAILEDRKDDPGAGDEGYVPSLARGHHHPDPDNPGQGFHAPFYGAQSKGFATTVPFVALDPPPFDDPEYVKALKEVRGRGIAPELMGTVPNSIPRRTIDQTVIGVFWAYDGVPGLGTPPRLYNQIIRRVADAQDNTEAKNARLFALVNVAMADAGILSWKEKYLHDFWRPVVGIREHDPSMGMAGQAKNNLLNDTDTGWLPLGGPATNSLIQNLPPQTAAAYPCNQTIVARPKNFTPPFPAYPSGHATFGAAAFHITRLFCGVAAGDREPDDFFKNLNFVSDEYNGVNQDNRGTIRPRHVRRFPDGLWQMIEENGRSRVYLGVHWVFDAFAVDSNGDMDLTRNVGGVPLGLAIAEDIFATGMMKSVV